MAVCLECCQVQGSASDACRAWRDHAHVLMEQSSETQIVTARQEISLLLWNCNIPSLVVLCPLGVR